MSGRLFGMKRDKERESKIDDEKIVLSKMNDVENDLFGLYLMNRV